MKKIVVLFTGLTMAFLTNAQLKTPALSPTTKIEQAVGLTNFELEYSRPSLRGREMYKEIINPNEMWRFGANKNTTISFDTDINFNGVDIKPGKYALFVTPNEKEWVFFFYKNTENWGLPEKFNDKDIVAKVPVKAVGTKEKVETFTIAFENLSLNDFTLSVSWGNQKIPVEITLPTQKLTLKSIEETMAKGSAKETDYFRAGSYLMNEDLQLGKALEYTEKAINMRKDVPAYYLLNRATILGKLKLYDNAIKAAQECMEVAEKAGNKEYVEKAKRAIEDFGSKNR